MSLNVRLPQGTAQMMTQLVAAHARSAIKPTGRRSRTRLTPQAWRAIHSLSAESRPKATSRPSKQRDGNGDGQRLRQKGHQQEGDRRPGNALGEELLGHLAERRHEEEEREDGEGERGTARRPGGRCSGRGCAASRGDDTTGSAAARGGDDRREVHRVRRNWRRDRTGGIGGRSGPGGLGRCPRGACTGKSTGGIAGVFY